VGGPKLLPFLPWLTVGDGCFFKSEGFFGTVAFSRGPTPAFSFFCGSPGAYVPKIPLDIVAPPDGSISEQSVRPLPSLGRPPSPPLGWEFLFLLLGGYRLDSPNPPPARKLRPGAKDGTDVRTDLPTGLGFSSPGKEVFLAFLFFFKVFNVCGQFALKYPFLRGPFAPVLNVF